MFKKKHRIVEIKQHHYQVQEKAWWFFWTECSGECFLIGNQHAIIKSAKEFLEKKKAGTLKSERVIHSE